MTWIPSRTSFSRPCRLENPRYGILRRSAEFDLTAYLMSFGGFLQQTVA